MPQVFEQSLFLFCEEMAASEDCIGRTSRPLLSANKKNGGPPPHFQIPIAYVLVQEKLLLYFLPGVQEAGEKRASLFSAPFPFSSAACHSLLAYYVLRRGGGVL